MNNLKLVTTEMFDNSVSCDFWKDVNDEYFITREQIGTALGYSNPVNAIKNIHLKHKDILDKYSTTVILKQQEGKRIINRKHIVYNLEGILLIIQYSQVSEKCKEDFLKCLKKEIGEDRFVIISGRKELEFINELKDFLSEFGIKGIPQYKVDDKYRIDYYITNLKIAIEYDENNHNAYDKNDEISREKYIIKKLGCRFIRVSDNKTNASNIGIIAKELFGITV